MLIIGMKEVSRTLETGGYYCPECTLHRPYRKLRRRAFLTLYFIPVIPISGASEHVQCEVCGFESDDSVLSLSEDDYRQRLVDEEFEHIRRAMVLTMLADDRVEETELDAMCQICEEVQGRPVSRDEFLPDVDQARRAKTNLIDYLAVVAGDLTTLGKDELVRACFLVATATGELDEAQAGYLEQLPKTLDMNAERFQAVVENAADES